MKKLIAVLLALVMVLGLVACGQKAPEAPVATEPTQAPTMAPYVPAEKSICLLVPAAQTAWETAAAEAAKAAAEEITAAGLTVTVETYADAQEQIALLEQIAASSTGDGSVGVVLMPAGEEVVAALDKLLEANVSYALAEYIPQTAAASSVCNVSYDHRQIGAAAAAYLVGAGMTQKNDLVILEGLSEEDVLKTEGFKLYLQGKMAVNGQYIESAWEDVSHIVYSEMEGATREGAKLYFEGYMEDGDRAYTGYFAAWDDAYVLGMLDATKDEYISEKNLSHLYAMEPVVTGFGATEELAEAWEAEAASEEEEKFHDINSISYDASMLQTALQAMADHMNGQVVEQEQILQVQWMHDPIPKVEE